MKNLWKMLTFYDKLLIISLILLSGFFIISPLASALIGVNQVADQVIIIQSGNNIRQKIPVADTYGSEPLLVRIDGPIGTSIIEAQNGRVRIKEAPPDDPEKICEKTGWIEQIGPMIICVPNQISVWIEAKESELDGVSW